MLKFLGGLSVAGFIFGIFWLVLIVPIFGFHYETGRGEHTGYITAVERHGLFFKTNTVYLKTDTQSSQEDAYCVIDDEVYAELQRLSSKKEHVNAYFFSWFAAGVTNCGSESDIIYKVETITN